MNTNSNSDEVRQKVRAGYGQIAKAGVPAAAQPHAVEMVIHYQACAILQNHKRLASWKGAEQESGCQVLRNKRKQPYNYN